MIVLGIVVYLIIAVGVARIMKNMSHLSKREPVARENNMLGLLWPIVISVYFTIAMAEFVSGKEW